MRNPAEQVRINMGDVCQHVFSIVQYSTQEIEELRDVSRCADCNCNGRNLWLCLAKDCKRVMCGDSKSGHSTHHYTIMRTHVVHQNMSTQRLWCYSCNRETFFVQQQSVSSNLMEDDESTDSEDGFLDVATPKGLQNIGNTCYMNSALQALCSIPQLSQYFMQSFMLPIGDDKKLSRNFQRLIHDMCDRNGPGYLIPNGILYGIRSVHPMFRGYQQHDTQEFLRCFMDQLHEELKEVVPEAAHRLSSANLSRKYGDVEEEGEEDDEGGDEQGDGGSGSGSQSEAEYETCDSGVSERSSLSDEGDRTSVKRKHSHSCSPPARCKLSQRPVVPFRGPSSPGNMKRRPLKYRSVISELFDGKLLSSVECLTCNKVSTRIETFQDLSLPIPSRDHVTMLHQGTLSPQMLATCSDVYKGKPSWVSWLWEWVKSWFWGPTVSLHDCLAAFFSADELKGDNMYSCEKCSKLRNGVKFSKVLDLPEVLCIHLKRFRHELAFSSKIASFVSFPLTGLDMRPYLHKDCSSEVTSYDLSSVICHHGTAGGGHYTCYAMNPSTKHWYELDDQCVTQVPPETVLDVEGYVLFYRKSNEKARKIWSHAMELLSSKSAEQSLMEFYVSRQWVNRIKTFAEPGPIDNSDFLCPHGGVHPSKVHSVMKLCRVLSANVWEYLYNEFRGGPACNRLYTCATCQKEQVMMHQRTSYELSQYLALRQEFKRDDNPPVIFALSMLWFRQWEAFVQGTSPEPPGPIDNTPIVTNVSGQKTLKLGSDYAQVSYDLWSFFSSTYGGGPELVIKQLARGPSRASFSSGISVEREKICASANKAKSVESLPVNFSGGDVATRSARTQSVSSDNVNIKVAAATAATHRKQQSLDNVRLERSIQVEDEKSRANQRKEDVGPDEENAYCPAFTPDELDGYVPFQKTVKQTTENVV